MYNRLQNQQDEPIADDFKFYGNYRGKVMDNEDPFKSGRIKVHVYGVYDNIPVENLPWAIYADPLMGGGVGLMSAFVPDIDTEVWVFFEGGDHHYPVFFAGAPAKGDQPEESQEGYPNNKVIKTKDGIVIELHSVEDDVEIRVKHPSGWQMIIDNDGNDDKEVPGNWNINVKGDWTINVDGHTTVNGPTIDLGESGLEPTVKGDSLAAWVDKLVEWADTHVHVGNLGSPTSPVQTPLQPDSTDAMSSGAGNGEIYSDKNTTQ